MVFILSLLFLLSMNAVGSEDNNTYTLTNEEGGIVFYLDNNMDIFCNRDIYQKYDQESQKPHFFIHTSKKQIRDLINFVVKKNHNNTIQNLSKKAIKTALVKVHLIKKHDEKVLFDRYYNNTEDNSDDSMIYLPTNKKPPHNYAKRLKMLKLVVTFTPVK